MSYSRTDESTSLNPLLPLLSDTLQLSDTGRHSTQRVDALSQKIRTSNCQACKLHEHRDPGMSPVPGEGRGRIMFVGHRIGRQEAYTNRPAIGDASQFGFRMFLEEMLAVAGAEEGIDFEEYQLKDARSHILDYGYVSNAARCGHNDSTRVSSAHWKRCGKQWLYQEITYVQPEIIIFWNSSAAKACVEGPTPEVGGIAEVEIYGQKIPCMVMTHPVAVAREASYESVVRGQFRILAGWLQEQGLLTKIKTEIVYVDPIDIEAEHILITDHNELAEMIEDLKPYEWVAIDTETTYQGVYGEASDYELKKGSVQWHSEAFQLVTVQICGLEPDGTVRKTYTVACGFKDSLTGAPLQEIKPREAAGALDVIFRHPIYDKDNQPINRRVCVWGASFDSPVLQRFGCDLLGFSDPNRYPIEILDGMLILHRMDEHLGEIGHLSLDSAAKKFLGEGKGGGFKNHFNPLHFPLSNIHDPKVRDKVLKYTGEDPRLTMLTVLRIMEQLIEHLEEVSDHTEVGPSSLPQIGFGPYPKVNGFYSGSRLWDTAMPVDHQMLPIIANMEMIGFRLDLDKIAEIESWVQQIEHKLLVEIHKQKSGYNPNSGPQALQVLERSFKEFLKGLNTVLDDLEKQLGQIAFVPTREKILRAVEIDPRTVRGPRPTYEELVAGYKELYSDFDSQQKTVEEKILIYFEASHNKVRNVIEDLKLDKRKEKKLLKLIPFVDVKMLESFFSKVFLYKQVGKKWSTYFKRFERIADKNQIVHPEYGQRTTSGRFQGNFQNIPRGGKEDQEWVEKLLKAINEQLPSDDTERDEYLARNNRLDVRQYVQVLQANDLNRQFNIMNLRDYYDNPVVVADRPYVGVFADYAAMEDRYAYALTGDPTKKKLLDNPKIDSHFYNVAFLYGDGHKFKTVLDDGSINEEGVMKAYEYFIANEKKYKDTYRTPTKNVHYASQFGAQDAKLHTMIAPLFAKMNKPWTFKDTKTLKARYDQLYWEVTKDRQEQMARLDSIPFVEYAIYGTLRHAKIDPIRNRVMQKEYLSVLNARNQGACAYITKTAMIRMRHLIEMNADRWNLIQIGGDNYVGIILQVHDEIGVMCPAHLAYEVSLCLESAMKMTIGPSLEETPVDQDGNPLSHWDNTHPDRRSETGWLYVPDDIYRGAVLMDADAEVKITIAKAATLADGTENVLAHMNDPDTYKHLEDNTLINKEYELILAREGFAPCVF